jgi:hypothetical protein
MRTRANGEALFANPRNAVRDPSGSWSTGCGGAALLSIIVFNVQYVEESPLTTHTESLDGW